MEIPKIFGVNKSSPINGKPAIRKYPNLGPLAKDTVSFGRNTVSENKKTMSDEQFSILRSDLCAQLTAMNEKGRYSPEMITRENVSFVKKVISDKNLSGNTSVMTYLPMILKLTLTEESAKAKCDFTDKIFSDPYTSGNKGVIEYFSDLLQTVDSDNNVRLKSAVIDDIKCNFNLKTNKNINNNLARIIGCTNNEFSKDVIDTVLADKKKYDSPELLGNFAEIIYDVESEPQALFAKYLVGEEKIYSEPQILSEMSSVITSIESAEEARARINIAGKLISDSRFTPAQTAEVISSCDNDEAYLAKEFILNKTQGEPGRVNPKYLPVLTLVAGTREQAELLFSFGEKYPLDSIFPEGKFPERTYKSILKSIDSQEKFDAKTKIIDKFLNEDNLRNNKILSDNLPVILAGCNTMQDSEATEILIDRYFNDEALTENVDFMQGMISVIYDTNTPENALLKLKITDKIVSDKEILNDGKLTGAYLRNIRSISTGEEADILKSILSNPYLKQNSDVIDAFYDYISTKNEDEKEKKAEFLEKTFSHPEIYENPLNLSRMHTLLYALNEHSDKINAVIDSVLSVKDSEEVPELCSSMYEIAADIVYSDFSDEKMMLFDAIVGNETLHSDKKLLNSTYSLLRNSMSSESATGKAALLNITAENPVLFQNPDFTACIFSVVNNIYDGESASEKMKFLEGFLNNDDFINNKPLLKFLPMFTETVSKKGQADVALELIKKYADDEKSLYTAYKTVDAANTPSKIQILNGIINDDQILLQQMYYMATDESISPETVKKTNEILGIENTASFNQNDLKTATAFIDFYDKPDISSLSSDEKRRLLKILVSSNADLFGVDDKLSKFFPLIPKNKEEYCELMPSLVRSLGIPTKPLTENQISRFNKDITELADNIAQMSDEEFNALDIKPEYDKNAFITDVLSSCEGLSGKEIQKVYDYFGFELRENERTETGYEITGYPVNFDDDETRGGVKDERVKSAIEKIRPSVVKFSENNKITTGNPSTDEAINKITEVLPEIITMAGKVQAGMNGYPGAHEFDLLKHSLKVMQKIRQNPEFEKLDDGDKRLLLLSSMLHDITKKEGFIDPSHPDLSSFDSFFIAKKFNLPKEDEIKLYTLIKHHEWLGKVNSSRDEEALDKNLKSVAYDLRHDNIFDMSLIFTHADLKAVKPDDSFHDRTEGKGRTNFKGETRSFGEAADFYGEKIKNLIGELAKSQPILPVTQIPSASVIEKAITTVNEDGSTDIKGVYKDKDGLVVIKFNEVEDWEAIGFPKGSISKGIEAKVFEKGEDTISNTGTIKFIVHGLDYSNQLAKFDAFSLIDSDALLSVSYTERPESKYRFFRTQGVILNADTKYIHGGGNTDSGSGYGKNIENFKENYIFGGCRESDRLYISELIKQTLGINDEEYVEFVKENANKPFSEIESKEVREKIIKAFACINSNHRKGDRSYNEMYVSNPVPMGVFAYNPNVDVSVGNPVEFLNGKMSAKTGFLKEYALKNDMPFIVFGD